MRGAIGLLLALSACGLRSQAPVLKQYQLDYAAPRVEAAPLPVVVRVDLLGVNAAYNRDGIAWRDGPYEVGTSATHRWATTPPRMITDLLARDLAASGRYEAVVQGVAPVPAAYVLGGEVEQLEADVSGDGCVARLHLRVLLTRAGAGAEPLLQQRYAADEPCGDAGPGGFVAASSAGLRALSERLQRDVYEAVAADLERPPAVASSPTPEAGTPR